MNHKNRKIYESLYLIHQIIKGFKLRFSRNAELMQVRLEAHLLRLDCRYNSLWVYCVNYGCSVKRLTHNTYEIYDGLQRVNVAFK